MISSGAAVGEELRRFSPKMLSRPAGRSRSIWPMESLSPQRLETPVPHPPGSLMRAGQQAAVALVVLGLRLTADSFGSGEQAFTVDFVPVGDPGNAPNAIPHYAADPSVGSVDHAFRMGTYEISRDQFLKGNTLGALGITLTDYGSPESAIRNRPATGISWNEAARFVNWLNTSSGFSPAYKFAVQPGEAGYDPNAFIELWTPADAGYQAANPYRNTQARYFIPNADEWYKAGYYDGAKGVYYDYPTGSNTEPIPVASGTDPGTAVYTFWPASADVTNAGGRSPYGTMAQGGNVFDWVETDFDGKNDTGRDVRLAGGGYSGDNGYILYGLGGVGWFPDFKGPDSSIIGFRVASTVIPEPAATTAVAGLMSACLVVAWRRGRRCRAS